MIYIAKDYIIYIVRGGPSYKDSDRLRLSVGDLSLETFVLSIFRDCPTASMVALKLPVNYDNEYLKQFAVSNHFNYSFFTNFRKMTLTILTRS